MTFVTQKDDNWVSHVEYDNFSTVFSCILQIVANKWTFNASATDFVATDMYAWGIGNEVITYLYNKEDDVCYRFIFLW